MKIWQLFLKNIAISNLVKESTAFCMYEGIKNDNILHYWKQHAVPKTYDFLFVKIDYLKQNHNYVKYQSLVNVLID